MGEWLLPTEKQLFVCDRFSQGEIASVKFPWILQKEQKNYAPVNVIPSLPGEKIG